MTYVELVTRIVKFKTSVVKLSLCDYSDACILVLGTISVVVRGADVAAKQVDGGDQGITFKNCAPFTDCISEINNNQIGNAKDLDVVMLIYNIIAYSDNYSKMAIPLLMVIQRMLK